MSKITVFNARPQGSPQEVVRAVLESDHLARDKVLVDALEEIRQVASGEKQVACDDTDGMAWIDNKARAALGEK